MTIYSFETLPSTQAWLIEKVKENRVDLPCAVIAQMQTEGIGSRDNRWIGKKGNFFASVAMPQTMLPDDLPISATSIYFAFLMKKTVEKLGSGAWVKWPNDLYLNGRKIGGCITAKKGDAVIAGIGVNIVDAPLDFGTLDLDITPLELLETFLRSVETSPSWKQIFSNFSLEFEKSKHFYTHVGNETLDLTDAVLNEDGSLMIGNRRVVSLR
ncbi:biotin--[acetyl-CoA-carboxylase] ligase [Hydrogenimonas cancrithermarum]|uniref:Biotin--[acetyl-CoA-carboxylase] ligase n=1 Tax=Hydrogenimonas cancrithermarum TaxID=2993563 RepID=A0ABM8FJ88_9BACT|nr:biotin--[acetyl-CoA-carboxylase] ligase [Hydrogenimonas cancrithermarum]BDY12348.1 biotin--[acetyl-CoA-carboxylase] ligase [Hydrogenimonas cancrithermarum]